MHSLHTQCLSLGMSPRLAARYLEYVRMKQRRHEEPIDIYAAVEQVLKIRGHLR